jgi:hypothetical protein
MDELLKQLQDLVEEYFREEHMDDELFALVEQAEIIRVEEF